MLEPQNLQDLMHWTKVLALSMERGANELAKIRCLLEEFTDTKVIVEASGEARVVKEEG